MTAATKARKVTKRPKARSGKGGQRTRGSGEKRSTKAASAKQRGKSAPKALLPPPPARVVAIANELQKLPGVVCVVWGSRKKGDRWFHRDPCLSVHVARKGGAAKFTGKVLPDSLTGLREIDLSKAHKRPLPKVIDGFRVDVLETGRPRLHSLSARGSLDGGALGLSTPTIVTTKGNDALALVSGHAAVGASTLELGGFEGEFLDGRFGKGGSVDWALVKFKGAAGSAQVRHPATGDNAPLELGSGIPGGAKLKQFSGSRQHEVEGFLQGVVSTNVNFGGDVYSSLLSVLRTAQSPFSVSGDSGSLIVDEHGSAVAVVVGGNLSTNTFYAYDVRALKAELSVADFKRFFEDP